MPSAGDETMDENDIDRQLREQQKYLDDQLLRYVVSEFAQRNLAGGVTLPETVKDAISAEFERAVSDSGTRLRETIAAAVQDLDRTVEKLKVSSVIVAENPPLSPPDSTQDKDVVQPPQPQDHAARSIVINTAAEGSQSYFRSKVFATIKSPLLWLALISSVLVAASVFGYITMRKSDRICKKVELLSRLSINVSGSLQILEPKEYMETLKAIKNTENKAKLTPDQKSVVYLMQVKAINKSELQDLKNRSIELTQYCPAGAI